MNIFEDDITQHIDLDKFEEVFTEEVKSVVRAIRKYGFDLRIVGGAVRDYLLGKDPRDIDLATDADPAELIFIFDLEDIAYDAKGIYHGTVKAVFNTGKIDVTSLAYQIDVEHDKMTTTKSNSWEADAIRRDVTVNSLSLDMDGNIHDYVNGLEDLQNGVIRLNKPQFDRIEGRPELILRWFKALSYFENPTWPKKDYELIKSHLDLLDDVKTDGRIKEKINQTLASLVSNPNGKNVVKLMCKMGVNKIIEINCY